MPRWEGSTRRESLPPNWERIRAKQLELDGHQCTARVLIDGDYRRCPERATDVDHKRDRNRHRPGYDLQSLCSWHHDKKSGAEGAAARHKILKENRQRFSRVEAHPFA